MSKPKQIQEQEQDHEQEVKTILLDQDESDDYGDDIEAEIEAKLGSLPSFTYIQLYRIRQDGTSAALKRYSELPSIPDGIQHEFGGGKYKLFMQWRDKDNGRRRILTRIFDIEGDPIPVNYSKAGTNGHEKPLDILEIAAKLKELGIIPNGNRQEKGSNDLIIETMKHMNQQTVEMIKMLSNNNGALVGDLLKASLEKTNELDRMLKYKELFAGEGSGGGDNWSSIVRDVAPSFLQLMAANKTPGAAPPGLAGNAVLTEIQNMFKQIIERMNGLEKRIKDIETETEPIEEPETKEPENGVDGMKTLADQIKALPEDKKIEVLKQQILVYGIERVQKFCIDYQVVNSVKEFVSYLQKAGLVNPPPQQAPTK